MPRLAPVTSAIRRGSDPGIESRRSTGMSGQRTQRAIGRLGCGVTGNVALPGAVAFTGSCGVFRELWRYRELWRLPEKVTGARDRSDADALAVDPTTVRPQAAPLPLVGAGPIPHEIWDGEGVLQALRLDGAT